MAANVTGLWVVVLVVVEEATATSVFGSWGQQTPGTKRLLKHRDCRRLPKLRRSWGQLLRSSQYLKIKKWFVNVPTCFSYLNKIRPYNYSKYFVKHHQMWIRNGDRFYTCNKAFESCKSNDFGKFDKREWVGHSILHQRLGKMGIVIVHGYLKSKSCDVFAVFSVESIRFSSSFRCCGQNIDTLLLAWGQRTFQRIGCQRRVCTKIVPTAGIVMQTVFGIVIG